MKRVKPGDPLRAIAYVTSVGRDEQHAAVQQLADAKGISIVEWFEDDVSSATPIEGRSGIVSAITALPRSAAGVLFVAAHDCLSSDPVVQATIVGIVRHKGASIIAARANQMRLEDARAGDAARMFDVMMAFVERSRGAAIRRTQQERRQQGRVTGRTPYGFRVAEDGTSLVRDPLEWKVIKFARAQHRKGLPFTKIAELCNEKGFRSRVGTPFFDTQIARMIEREGSERGRTIM